MSWSDFLQRGCLAALVARELGPDPAIVPPEVFTEGRARILLAIQDFHGKTGKLPERTRLPDLIREQGLPPDDALYLGQEVRHVLHLKPQDVTFCTAQVRTDLRRHALKQAALRLDELADGESSRFGVALEVVQKALQATRKTVAPLDLQEGAWERHLPHEAQEGRVSVPTGFPTVDDATDGGLHSGELGLILASTGRGKSHVGVQLGTRWLNRGGRVLHLTLELQPKLLARRYDRCLTGMDTFEIRDQKAQFLRAWEKALPEPDHLRIYGYPRYSITTQDVRDHAKRELDHWGAPGLVIVDYGSILRPLRQDSRHLEVGRIHEALSSLAMEEGIPVWTPFQANRKAEYGESELDDTPTGVTLRHAGESYEAMQHSDLVVSMTQNREDVAHRRVRISIEKSRESGACTVMARCDWSRSRIEELTGATKEQGT